YARCALGILPAPDVLSQRLGIVAVESALDHALRQPACWDRSPTSYVTRYSRSFDRRLIRNSAEFGAGLNTGEDLRYQRNAPAPSRTGCGTPSAARSSHTTDGRGRPAYTRFALQLSRRSVPPTGPANT